MPELHPPLKLWLVSGILFGVVFVACYLLAWKEDDKVLDEKYAKEALYLLDHYVKEYESRSSKPVMAMGSSLVGQGIRCGNLTASHPEGRQLHKLFLNSTGDLLVKFKRAGVFDTLLKYPPAVLLLEADQLTYRLHVARDWKDEWNRGALFLNHLKTLWAFRLGNYRMPEYCGKVIHGVVQDSAKVTFAPREVLSFADRAYIHGDLQKLRQAGVRIVLLHIPRPAFTENKLHQGPEEWQYQALLKQYNEKYGTEYWHYPAQLPFRYFYDQGHLNEEGKQLYSRWLFQKLLTLNP